MTHRECPLERRVKNEYINFKLLRNEANLLERSRMKKKKKKKEYTPLLSESGLKYVPK